MINKPYKNYIKLAQRKTDRTFDVIIIGSGTGGMSAASFNVMKILNHSDNLYYDNMFSPYKKAKVTFSLKLNYLLIHFNVTITFKGH
ncbi:MAG: glutamate racemase [Alteromonadaceae bacterium]|jgi:glutamate racemase|tara:strand:+ start:1563 stop:1823 length:261 start_codon:yes stop_codon:yes gene_type:complete